MLQIRIVLFLFDLSISYDRVGSIYSIIGETKQALHYYQEALKIAEDVTDREPDRIDYKIHLTFICYRILRLCPEEDKLKLL